MVSERRSCSNEVEETASELSWSKELARGKRSEVISQSQVNEQGGE